jgi:hypothetical protein
MMVAVVKFGVKREVAAPDSFDSAAFSVIFG